MVLNKKQERFCEEYLMDLNAAQAAVRAGYTAGSAKNTGYRILKKPEARERISRLMGERSERTCVGADTVLEELCKVAFTNLDDIVDFGSGAVKEGAAREGLAAVSSVKVKTTAGRDGTSNSEHEVKVYDKMKALELVGRHLGMWGPGGEAVAGLRVVVNYEDGA